MESLVVSKRFHVVLCLLGYCFCLFYIVKSDDTIGRENVQQKIDPVHLYRRLLRQKRDEQLAAVKQIQAMESEEKQRQLVDLMLTRICTVLGEKKLWLMEAGFTPGDPFPLEENARDALSSVAENTALLGDILLRAPDATHALLGQNPEWTLLARWSVSFMNESRLYEKREQTLLNLMAQELNIVPRDPNYVNPFRQDPHLDKLADEILREAERERKKEEKREKRKKQRGPRLAGGEL